MTRLSFGETAEFLQAVVFVLCETLVQLVEVEAVKINILNSKADVTEEIIRKRINDPQLCSQVIINT